MSNDIQLTIIMSNYNQEKFIRKAIDSILMQNVNFKYKLIITDDCSKNDNSLEIIKEYANKYPEIIYPLYNKENGGYLVNILRAKEITKTPFFCLLDADDYYTDPKFLQRAYDFLCKNNEYVIYYENVNYLYEDNTEKPFISLNTKSGTFDINDYLNNQLPIVQTTGQFYRNVIFQNGIPQIMKDAIGTYSERSFEGDYDRFIMHLKYGKAYFNNQICGVYRILSTGIWSRLSNSKKLLLHIQTYYDYNRYFDQKYISYFVTHMYKELLSLIENIKNLNVMDFNEDEFSQFMILYRYISENNTYINYKKEKRHLSGKIKRIIKFLLRK